MFLQIEYDENRKCTFVNKVLSIGYLKRATLIVSVMILPLTDYGIEIDYWYLIN